MLLKKICLKLLKWKVSFLLFLEMMAVASTVLHSYLHYTTSVKGTKTEERKRVPTIHVNGIDQGRDQILLQHQIKDIHVRDSYQPFSENAVDLHLRPSRDNLVKSLYKVCKKHGAVLTCTMDPPSDDSDSENDINNNNLLLPDEPPTWRSGKGPFILSTNTNANPTAKANAAFALNCLT
jgi:hypothetical protein